MRTGYAYRYRYLDVHDFRDTLLIVIAQRAMTR
jgi:hypothetical protein